MKRVEQCYFKALKTGFVENKGQSGPLSADSKTQGKFSVICQLPVKISAICQLSVNPIQTLFLTPLWTGVVDRAVREPGPWTTPVDYP